jgi:hypothetical protein
MQPFYGTMPAGFRAERSSRGEIRVLAIEPEPQVLVIAVVDLALVAQAKQLRSACDSQPGDADERGRGAGHVEAFE